MDLLSTASRKYRLRTALFMGGYVAVNMAAILGAFDDIKHRGAVALALLIAIPLAGQIWSLIAWMSDGDEFMRAVTAKRFIVATGLTLSLSSAWGLLELYAGAPHISMAMVFPLFCAAFGIVTPFIRTSH